MSIRPTKPGADLAGATAASYTTPATVLGDNGAAYSVVVSNGVGSPATSASVLLTVNPPALGPLTWKRDVIYLGSKEVAEIDADGTHVTLTDHLGSPRFLVRGNGEVVEQKFAPFGESLTDPSTMAKFAKGYTNHEQTDPSGLIYMQARFYAPMYHRFLSPDPGRDQHFEETQSWNIYSYVQNNPLMKVDLDGMAGVWVSVIFRGKPVPNSTPLGRGSNNTVFRMDSPNGKIQRYSVSNKDLDRVAAMKAGGDLVSIVMYSGRDFLGHVS